MKPRFLIPLSLFIWSLSSTTVLADNFVRHDFPVNDRKDCKVAIIFYSDYDMTKHIGNRYLWDGKCAKGYVQGSGTIKNIRPDGEIRLNTANFIDGRAQGPGTYETESPNGLKIVFSGIFLDSFYVRGTRTVINPTTSYREVYEGAFLGYKKSGKGTLYVKQKNYESTYSGDFLNNQRNGWGTINWPDNGLTWTGPFTNGQMNGTGRYSTRDGQYGSMQFANGEQISAVADPQVQPEIRQQPSNSPSAMDMFNKGLRDANSFAQPPPPMQIITPGVTRSNNNYTLPGQFNQQNEINCTTTRSGNQSYTNCR